eukprot:Seg2755.2 transcript_id=Seg2755.2/GoldUCD/mRNA.D3Y31 product="hypothetical protein" protein_id=Seg2755.2/GoldUCD/D3Y31
MASKAVRTAIETGAEVKVERRIFLSYPGNDEHKFHPIGAEAGIAQQVDSRIINFIHVRVSEGVRNVKEMKRHIKSYVKNDLFKDHTLPAPINRRFYPSNVTVRNHIYLATVRLRFSKIHQVNLENKIEELKNECPRDSFYYRKYSDVKPDCDLHQQLSKLKDDAAVTDMLASN